MNEMSLVERERSLVRDLAALIAERAAAETTILSTYQTRKEAIERELHEALPRLEQRLKSERSAADAELAESKEFIVNTCTADYTALQQEYDAARAAVEKRFEEEMAELAEKIQEGKWTTSTLLEADRRGAEDELKEVKLRIAAEIQKLQPVLPEARKLLKSWRMGGLTVSVSKPSAAGNGPLQELEECSRDAFDLIAQLRSLRLPRVFIGLRPLWIFLGLWLVLYFPTALAFGFDPGGQIHLALGISGLAALVISVFGLGPLYYSARAWAASIYRPLCQTLVDAEAARKRYLDQATERHQKLLAAEKESRERHAAELRRIQEEHKRLRAEVKERHERGLRAADDKYRPRLAEILQRQELDLRAADEKHRRTVQAARQQHDAELQAAKQKHRRHTEENETRYRRDWGALVSRWRSGLEKFHADAEDIQRICTAAFPEWTAPVWQNWQPPSTLPPGLRFGAMRVALDQFPGGIPQDERLCPAAPTEVQLPALLPFPRQASLLFKAADSGRQAAVQSLQAIMMRFLTCLPPGKVRFTILDPVGLGENFAAFMHLADHDEALVGSRIWTEAIHLEQRLADVTAHMENVIQKYLRNQYESIDEYNAKAGEVAEPFRVVVAANFPANFTIDAARRLVSIVASGARCGVFTLITVDLHQPLPQGFHLQDLEQSGAVLIWSDGRFVWKDRDFERHPLHLDPPPPDDFSTRILEIVGERAAAAKRVEVPFEFVAPPLEQWWTGDCRAALRVAIGRAGATKRQHLQLGVGTAQHAVVAGKTGSGKSTLLHALITNLALQYSPDQVELYLVDFKKGVEFKTYAANELPHARVVAIESEREFGLSVLQRLDEELRRRGDQFRALGAQDLAAARAADPGRPYPRVLLIVDEFQEFFVEDDKLASEAALVLDRLVRQGRAFGIHVLLGSQTLGGAYTLARSTIDQMAVRIALQCSEADAHMILSEDNAAARLLSRPGEAIYNDANGLVEGNNPFQVVWLDDERREQYLQRVRQLAASRGYRPPQPQIVFEGNLPAELPKNPLLAALLNGRALHPQPPVEAARFWLGDAIAIKEPTSAVFRPQSGGNLLLVGQDDQAALGIFHAIVLGLAAQQGPRSGNPARFVILDASAEGDEPGPLARLAQLMPCPVELAGRRQLPGVIGELAAEVERRLQASEPPTQPVYLLVFGLHGFRDLRRAEDDFSFSSGPARPTPDRHFAAILRDGPGVRVHAIVWCDSMNNLQRALDRASQREFEMRVVFQMSAADSSNLIDTPLASKLGLHRALFHNEEQGKLEKFRPYGLPPQHWLEQAAQLLKG